MRIRPTVPVRVARLAAIVLAALVLLLLVAAGALALWLPSGDELARRVEQEASSRLGVGVKVGSVRWSLLPMPYAEVLDVRTAQPEPIVIGRMAAFPLLAPLWQRELRLARLEVEHAVFPRESVRAFRGKTSGMREQAAGASIPLERAVLRDVTYISWSGVPVAYDADIDFDPHWRPRYAQVRRPGAPKPASLTLDRDGRADRWKAQAVAGGGSADGEFTVLEREDGHLTLQGTLEPRRVDIAAAVATFHRDSPLGGLASGRTVIFGQGDTPGEVGRSLRTVSDLKVDQGVVLRFDLDKAVQSLGKERAGQTRLDSLSGRVTTQNTEQGMRVHYDQLQATAGNYTAEGEATVYQRQVDAKGTLDIVDGLVGVPFSVKGPTKQPDFKIPPGFFAGAAVGTAILPGIGTVIGARIGGLFGRGGDDDKAAPKKGAAQKKSTPQKTTPGVVPGGPRAR